MRAGKRSGPAKRFLVGGIGSTILLQNKAVLAEKATGPTRGVPALCELEQCYRATSTSAIALPFENRYK